MCRKVFNAYKQLGLEQIANWVEGIGNCARPGKGAQDGLDACICLWVALHFSKKKPCLMVGNTHTGYMIVPANAILQAELETRCIDTGRLPGQWVRLLGAS